MNINLPNVIEMLCSVAIIWANLAYLLVTLPLLLSRLRTRNAHSADAPGRALRYRAASARLRGSTVFLAGPLGALRQCDRGRLGPVLVINIGWPRLEIYGSSPWGRFAAPLATLG